MPPPRSASSGGIQLYGYFGSSRSIAAWVTWSGWNVSTMTASSSVASLPIDASAEIGLVRWHPAVRVLRVVEVHRRLGDLERMERVDHDRQLLGRLLADRCLRRDRPRQVASSCTGTSGRRGPSPPG